jgi:hypothetical protein
MTKRDKERHGKLCAKKKHKLKSKLCLPKE